MQEHAANSGTEPLPSSPQPPFFSARARTCATPRAADAGATLPVGGHQCPPLCPCLPAVTQTHPTVQDGSLVHSILPPHICLSEHHTHSSLSCGGPHAPPHNSFFLWKNLRRYISWKAADPTHTASEKMLNHATLLLVSSLRSRISCSRCCSCSISA